MAVLIILAKVGIVAAYVSIVMMVLQFKKLDRNVKIEFDLLSKIELSAAVGIALVGLVSVIDPTTYVFTLVLCLCSIGLTLLQRYRMILAGDTMVLFRGKAHPIRTITKLGTGMFTLKIYLKNRPKPVSIYVPLTSNHVLRDRVQSKLRKKK